MAKMNRFTFTITVKAPASMVRKEAKRLLKRLIDIWWNDTDEFPKDYLDGDVTAIHKLKIGKPADPKLKGFAVVREADGQVIGPVRVRPTWEEAIALALTLATQQTDANPKKLRAELESEYRAADPDGGWAVYVTGLEP